LKIGPNCLFYAAQSENPYSLNVWIDGNSQNLLSLNENEGFDNFALVGDLKNWEDNSKVSNSAICYNQTYMKIWNCDTGSFVQEYDYSRKVLKQLEIFGNGRYLVANQELGSKLRLIDLVTSKDLLIFESKEQLMMQKLNETTLLITQTLEGKNEIFVLNFV